MNDPTTVVVTTTIRALDASGNVLREERRAVQQPYGDCVEGVDWCETAARAATVGLNMLGEGRTGGTERNLPRRAERGTPPCARERAPRGGGKATETATADGDGGAQPGAQAGVETPACGDGPSGAGGEDTADGE